MEVRKKLHRPPSNVVYEIDGSSYGLDDGLVGAVQASIARRLETDTLEIPRLPQVAGRILQLSQNPDTDLDEIVGTISTDPVLATRVLTVVNSAAYASAERIEGLKPALMHLGFNAVRDLVFAESIRLRVFSARSYRSILEDSWRLSLGVEILLSQLHEEIGAYVLERWDMPPTFVAAAREHHRYRGAAHATPAQRLVHAGNRICQHLGIGDPQKDVDFTIERVFADLTLSDVERVSPLLDQVSERMERMMGGLREAA